ncbi:MAG: GHMP kinase [Clostridiales Family XIII bacterium]|jgi:D-glycero-alpha-D-manno-heptose-7-phosphate kinase|nr:GHMP kinase [Clostridiales Family XIII bacterium]
MIITKTPYRITFAGGGTDLKDYYKTGSGACVSTSINKYMYISVQESFSGKFVLHYVHSEKVDNYNEIKHPILKESLKLFKPKKGIEVSSVGEIAGKSGLGSSGTFTVGLLKALHKLYNEKISDRQLAEEAIYIERDILGGPVGKQDQYAASFGSFNLYQFNKDETVLRKKVKITDKEKKKLSDNLILLYTGMKRRADSILKTQKKNTKEKRNLSSLDFIRSQAFDFKKKIEDDGVGNWIGDFLHSGYEAKKNLSVGITNELIDNLYDTALKNGAKGGRIIGAGGGGFLLFYCEKKYQEEVIEKTKAKNIPFSFEDAGSTVIYSS